MLLWCFHRRTPTIVGYSWKKNERRRRTNGAHGFTRSVTRINSTQKSKKFSRLSAKHWHFYFSLLLSKHLPSFSVFVENKTYQWNVGFPIFHPIIHIYRCRCQRNNPSSFVWHGIELLPDSVNINEFRGSAITIIQEDCFPDGRYQSVLWECATKSESNYQKGEIRARFTVVAVGENVRQRMNTHLVDIDRNMCARAVFSQLMHKQ